MADYLGEITIQLARSVIPVIMTLGIVGNSINIAILMRPNLYHHSCSRYFLALSISSLAYSVINLTYRLLIDGYKIEPTRSSLVTCKLLVYITQLCIPLAPYFIVVASFDRFCASSTNARIRQFSHVRVSRWVILLVVIVFALFYINSSVVVDLRPEDGLGCRNRGDSLYKQTFTITQCVVYAIVAPTLMALFGFLTIYNAKQVGNGRILASRTRRTEGQLIIMLLLQVSTHIVLTMPASIIYAMLVLPTGYKGTRLISFVYFVCNLACHLSYASAFPLYFLSARIYRQEFLRLVSRVLKIPLDHRIGPITNTLNTNGTLTGEKSRVLCRGTKS